MLRDLVAAAKDSAAIRAKIDEQMAEIFTVVGICLGIPPTTFAWEYVDKSKAYKKLASMTPVEFYQQHVKQCFDVDNKVGAVSGQNDFNLLY